MVKVYSLKTKRKAVTDFKTHAQLYSVTLSQISNVGDVMFTRLRTD